MFSIIPKQQKAIDGILGEVGLW